MNLVCLFIYFSFLFIYFFLSGDTIQVKNFVEIALSHSVSEINRFLHLTQKFKMAAKSHIPCGSKISSKSLYLAPFPR